MYLKRITIEHFRKYNDQQIIYLAHDENDHAEDKNIAKDTTLLVGKNNSGKTSIIRLLDTLSDSSAAFNVTDFSYEYIQQWVDDFKKQKDSEDMGIEPPYIKIEFEIAVDKPQTDYLQNISPFMKLDQDKTVKITMKYCTKEEFAFISAWKEYCKQLDQVSLYSSFITFLGKMIEDDNYSMKYITSDGNQITNKYSLKNLLDIIPIYAIHITKEDNALAEQFGKILGHRLKKGKLQNANELQEALRTFNEEMNEQLGKAETADFNAIAGSLLSSAISVSIRSALGLEDVMNKTPFQYEYEEGNQRKRIPEGQFGLGYSSLLMIIAKILLYIETSAKEEESYNQIHLICIEEPETHMHPQMQEMFIRNISKAIKGILKDKYLNFQILITTHSPHILSSKILEGGTFSDINVLTETDQGCSKVIHFDDGSITGNSEEKASGTEEFKFIQKHIGLGMADMFFADALVMVEGDSEMKLIPFLIRYTDKYKLKTRYVSVVSVDGAHSYVYRNMLERIGIPTAIITDLDIVVPEEKDEIQITSLDDRYTTNKTLWNFCNLEETKGSSRKIDESAIYDTEWPIPNIGVFTQTKTDEYYPRSLEEAIILANPGEGAVWDAIKATTPRLAKEKKELKAADSAYWQSKLDSRKGAFSSQLLYVMMTDETKANNFNVPEYIDKALHFLGQKLSLEATEEADA